MNKTQGFHSSSPGSIPVGRDEIWEDIQPKNRKNLTLDITQNSLPLSHTHTQTSHRHTLRHVLLMQCNNNSFKRSRLSVYFTGIQPSQQSSEVDATVPIY